jgi:hypothetical protein
MNLKCLSLFTLALALTSFAMPSAKADTLFTGSQAGICCFDVNLHQVDPNSVQVTVNLTDGAQYFISSGGGNHPGFAFNVAGDPTISVTSISGPWSISDVHLTPVNTNGPSLGTFDYFIDNPGNGANAHNDGPLVFTVFDAAGITASDFVANASGFYFAADIMNAAGNTGMSGINTPGNTPAVPEPSSLALLGTGILSAASLVRRRLRA